MNGSPTLPGAAGAAYRFIVHSAEEAVRTIQEKLGPHARVVSVRQVDQRGLARLLRAPQLEVIAEVAQPLAISTEEAGPEVNISIPEEMEAVDQNESVSLGGDEDVAGLRSNESRLERLLAKAGISERLLLRWRTSPRWESLQERPLSESLNEVARLLRSEANARPAKALGSRVAFFGPPGVGSTTALCKALTSAVFFRQEAAVVIKLDGDQPNPAEGLAMFCEALDVPLLRSADDLNLVTEECRIYFDAAGPPLRHGSGWKDLGKQLNDHRVSSRVLVLNAAYEADLLKRGYALGKEAGATHVVFTHLDEVPQWGKLWEFMLHGDLVPLFLSCGQNVSGDLREDVFGQMVQRLVGGAAPGAAYSSV
jgi:flagellar biosynthesis protein FlhF